MTTSDNLSADELIVQMQKRIAELEKANQALHAEILERKRAEEVLREREERFRTVIENSRDGINMLDLATGRYVLMSPSQVEMTGFTAEEISSISAEEAYKRVHPEDRRASISQHRLVTSGLDAISTVEYRWKVKSGEYRWFSDSRKLVRDSKGHPIALVGVSRDITERKQAEESLREAYEEIQMQSEELQESNEELQIQSEELKAQAKELEEAYKALSESEKRYRLLFDQSMDAIILTDPRNGGKILSANPAACRMLGWSEEELIGKGRDIMFDLADPALSTLLNERARSGSAKAQLNYRRKDGTAFPGEVSSVFFIDNNREPRTVAIIRDITERKRAEEALNRERSLLESVMRATDFMLVFLDPRFNFLWVNPAYAEACQMKPEEMIGRNHFELYPHAENEAIFRKVLNTGEGVFYKDKLFVYPDQPERGATYWDWSLAPVKDSSGNVAGLVLSLRETTKYKQAEEALRKSEERYRMLFTNMTEAFYLAEIICDKDGKPYDYRYLEANPACGLNSGFEKAQIIGKSHLEVFPKANQKAIEEFGKVALSGKSARFEIFSLETGRYLDIYAFSPEKGRFAVIFSDITERKQMEEALRASEVRYRSLYENSLDGILLTGPDGTVLSANPQACRMFGMTESEIIQTGRESLIVRDERIATAIKKKKLTGQIKPELTCRRKNGSTFVCDITSNPFKDADGTIKTSTIIRDITESKQAEEALRKSEESRKIAKAVEAERQRLFEVLETLPAMICLLTPDYHIAFANRSFREKFGELDNRHCYEYCYGLTRPCKFCESYKVLETGQPHHWEINNPDGSVSDAYDFPFTDVDGSPMILEMDIDITERRKAEEALAKIEEARIKEIHHRIKNNLQVISSLLSLEAERFSDPKTLESFRESQSRVASMALIHEELYKNNGSDNLDFSEYLRKLTANLLNSYNLKNNVIGLRLNFDQVYLDMDTAIPLGIIINELVSNSLKHAFPDRREGEIKVILKRMENSTTHNENSTAENRCKEETNFRYILTVADNGKGIPEEVDLQTVESLGLQLVNILVEQIDGCIEIKRDQGTEFTIWFNNIEK